MRCAVSVTFATQRALSIPKRTLCHTERTLCPTDKNSIRRHERQTFLAIEWIGNATHSVASTLAVEGDLDCVGARTASLGSS